MDSLIRVLDRTGLISEQAILDEIGTIKTEMAKKKKGN